MKTTSLIGLLAGLAMLALLVVWQGVETVAGLLGEAGWAVLLVCIFAPIDQVFGSEAWRRLFPSAHRPGFGHTFLASWMGSAVNTLLPVATIGGEVVKARVLTLWNHSPTHAVSTMVVDKTAQAIVVLVWGLVGITLLAVTVDDPALVWGALVGAGLLALGIGGFIAVQLGGGLSFMARTASGAGSRVWNPEKWQGIIGSAQDVDDAIKAIYRHPGVIFLAVGVRLVARVVLVGEILLAAYLMGHPIGIMEAVLLKGLVVAVRGISFAVPGGYGLQEGSYIAIGLAVGLPADLMLAISLATRVREIVPSIPFLLVWQNVESRALWRRRSAAAQGQPDT